MSFIDNFTADGDGREFTSSDPFTVSSSGTFSGSLNVHMWKGEVLGFEALVDLSLPITEAGGKTVDVQGLNRFKLVLSGATSPDLNAYVSGDTVLEV